MRFFRGMAVAVAVAGVLMAGLSACGNGASSAGATSDRIEIPSNHDGARIGFGSGSRLDEHFAKHGAEFGNISEREYLLAAQRLRDRPAGGDVLEIVRGDGTVSRFDRGNGAFLAFNRDRTIRTYFKPNDGERYFRRQARRTH